jgi:hypothetical protein
MSGMGIFDNSAIDEHDQVTHKIRRDGVALTFACRGCATPKELVVEWPEIIALKYGIDPALAYRNMPNIVSSPTRYEWSSEESGWMPDLQCKKCEWRLAVVIAPDEPERWLSAGRRTGVVSQASEQKISQYVRGMAQAARQRMNAAQLPQRVR